MTTEPLPAPLVAADVDLNGYQFMPLYGHRLFGSEFNARCSDAAWRAGVTLWWAAWNQVPAASLPDDDAALCRLADLGRDVKAWRKIRADALHGFVKCSDGRLYHRALAEYAAEAWDRRVRDRARKAAWRAGRNADGDRDGTRTETGTHAGQRRDVPADRDRDRDRERDRDKEERKEGEAKSPPDLGGGRQVELLAGVPRQEASPIDEAVTAWNELADRKGLARVQKLTDVRKRSLRHRLHDAGGIEGWRAALAKVEASAFLIGTNPRGWRADFDWIITERAFTRLMEGQFERTRSSSSSFGEGMRNQIADAMEAAREIDRLDAEREGRTWPEQQVLSQP